MADKKTSQETSGAPITKLDLHRIARSGDNYKLTSEEIFCETLTNSAFQSKATSGDLIAGRYYKVTGVGVSAKTILVLAYSNSNYTNINPDAVYTSGAKGSIYIFEETSGLNTIKGEIDSNANISLGFEKPNTVSTGTIFTPAYFGGSGSGVIGTNGFIYSQIFGGAYQRDNTFASLSYSTFRDCTIYIDPTSGGITNSYIQGININLINGASLSNCTIIGDKRRTSGLTYTFDGVSLTGETIIVGEFSTAEMSLRNGVDYNDVLQTLTLPANSEWVGRFNLEDFTGTEMLTYIDALTNSYLNDHTPVKFWNVSGGNQILTTHINNPSSSSGLGEMMFPHHHGSNDNLHTIYSYLKGKYDMTSNLWVITDFIDYD